MRKGRGRDGYFVLYLIDVTHREMRQDRGIRHPERGLSSVFCLEAAKRLRVAMTKRKREPASKLDFGIVFRVAKEFGIVTGDLV